MKYIISSILSLAVLALAFFYFRNCLRSPYELPDDEAWECVIGKRKAHLLAERSDVELYSKRQVLVQWENGRRSWENVSRLPHYRKISAVNVRKRALVSVDSVESLIVGKTLRDIESTLACASRIKGSKVAFPIKVLKRDESVSADSVMVTFRDSVATAVEYKMTPDKDAKLYSMVPGLFLLIDRGVKAPQRDGYISHLAGDEKVKDTGYHFGDFTLKVVKFIFKLLVFILFLAFVVLSPIIVASPVLMLGGEDFISSEIAIALGILVELVCLYAFVVVYFIFDGPGWFVPLLSLVACTVLTTINYRMQS